MSFFIIAPTNPVVSWFIFTPSVWSQGRALLLFVPCPWRVNGFA